MKTVIVIPSRYASSRFPGKPLALIQNIPMIVHVLKQAKKSRLADEVIVATDDERISEVVIQAGGTAVMTDPDLPTGTDRVSAALAGRAADLVVNLQGDEPLINPENIDIAIQALIDSPNIQVSTLATPISSAEELWNTNVVKVLLDYCKTAVYFSRTPIPQPVNRDLLNFSNYLRHVGLYVFRRYYLDEFINFSQCWAEITEHLEQLRILHFGGRIAVRIVNQVFPGVDTHDDLVIIEKLLKKYNESPFNQEKLKK